jgi:hypothetical protein
MFELFAHVLVNKLQLIGKKQIEDSIPKTAPKSRNPKDWFRVLTLK